MEEIKNLKRWSEEFFNPIDWDTFFLHGRNGNSCYGFEALFKLSTILGLLGCKTYQSKEDYLKVLEKLGKLNEFYRIFNVVWANQEQCKRKNYNRPSDSEFHYLGDFINLDAYERFRNQTLIPECFIEECKKRELVLISVDGKYIRNSVHFNSKNQHIKSMNFVCMKKLVHSVFARSENHWIKTELGTILLYLRKTLPGHLVFSGDSIYNIPTLREEIKLMPKSDFIFSLKENSALKNAALEAFNRRHHSCVFAIQKFKRKGQNFKDQITLCPREPAESQAYLRICRTISFRETMETFYFYIVFSQQLPHTLETLNLIYDLKKEHWQVEEYHKKKDTLLFEDDYVKSQKGAKIHSIENDLILNFYKNTLGEVTKSAIQGWIDSIKMQFSDFIRSLSSLFFRTYFIVFKRVFQNSF